MIFLLAQAMPGMEWIPFMCVAVVGGYICGLVALTLRIFGSDAKAGLRLGKVTVGIGVGSVLLFLLLERSNLSPVGYLLLATPILPGVAVLVLPTTKGARFALRIVYAIAAVAVVAGLIWYGVDRSAPSGVAVELPTGYEGETASPALRNPFGLLPAVDAEGQLFVGSFQSQTPVPANISADLPFLQEFAGPHRELLLRHLASSAKWFVGKDIVNGQEKFIVQRRYVESGMWNNPLNGFFNETGKQFRIVLGLDGPAYAVVFPEATFAKSNQRDVPLKVVPSDSGDHLSESYLVVTSSGATLELFEQSARKDHPFTSLALSQLNQEFQAVLSSQAARDRGFDPALMPSESIRRGTADMHVITADEGEGNYQVQAYVNPGASGYVYLKVFEGRGSSRVGEDDYSTRKSIEYVGWSSDPQEQFFYNAEFEFGEGLINDTFPARVEMWFVPSSGGPERKLIEKYFRVK